MTSVLSDKIDDIIDQLYERIHQYLEQELKGDLTQDLVDIDLEVKQNEIIVNIDLYIEISPFSTHDVQQIAEDAVKHGIAVADQIIVNIRYK